MKATIEKLKRKDCEWIFILNSNSTLCQRDICQLLKVTTRSLTGLISRGEFPKHTSTIFSGKYRTPKHQWSSAVVIKAIQKYIE